MDIHVAISLERKKGRRSADVAFFVPISLEGTVEAG